MLESFVKPQIISKTKTFSFLWLYAGSQSGEGKSANTACMHCGCGEFLHMDAMQGKWFMCSF